MTAVPCSMFALCTHDTLHHVLSHMEHSTQTAHIVREGNTLLLVLIVILTFTHTQRQWRRL